MSDRPASSAYQKDDQSNLRCEVFSAVLWSFNVPDGLPKYLPLEGEISRRVRSRATTFPSANGHPKAVRPSSGGFSSISHSQLCQVELQRSDATKNVLLT